MKVSYHGSLLPAEVSVAHLMSAMSVATGINFENILHNLRVNLYVRVLHYS